MISQPFSALQRRVRVFSAVRPAGSSSRLRKPGVFSSLDDEVDDVAEGFCEGKARNDDRLFAPALVLNADFTPLSQFPLSVWSWQDAIKMILNDKAVVVAEHDARLLIRTVSVAYRPPSVIALKEYRPQPIQEKPALNRSTILLRDGFRCQVCAVLFYCLQADVIDLVQYCGEVHHRNNLTLDHVLPLSRGGASSWTNLVCCCTRCNVRKGKLTLSELHKVNMRLRSSPTVPTTMELQAKGKEIRLQRHNLHPHWKDFVK